MDEAYESCVEAINICQCLALECKRFLSNDSVLMEKCYMDSCFISKRALPDDTLVQVTILYLTILLIGLFGNLTTVVVIKTHPVLQTHTSRYLLNLALADLLTITAGLPFEIYMNWNQYPWPFPDFVCNLKALIAEATCYVTVMTILLFSVERYAAICHPFFFVKLERTRKKLPSVLLLIWIVAIVSAAPYGINHRADYLIKSWPQTENNQPIVSSKMCMMAVYFEQGLSDTFEVLFHLSALVFFVIPLGIIFVLYVLIAIKVRRSRRAFALCEEGPPLVIGEDNSARVTMLLASVVLAFFICYLPFQLQRLLFFYLKEHGDLLKAINQHIYYISGLLFYLATIINPIIYNVMSRRFRRATSEAILSICRPLYRRKHAQTSPTSVRYIVSTINPSVAPSNVGGNQQNNVISKRQHWATYSYNSLRSFDRPKSSASGTTLIENSASRRPRIDST